jgi:hypothetical protein
MKTTFRALFAALLLIAALPSGALGIGADNFANRTTIPGTFFLDTTTTMENYTRELNEPIQGPNPAAVGMDRTAWWRWVAPSDGLCTVEIPDTGKFIVKTMTVYTGSSLNSLTRVADGSLLGSLSCSATFYAAAGTEYNIAVEAEGVVVTTEVVLILRHLPANYPGRYLGEWQSNFQELVPAGNGLLTFAIAQGGGVTGVFTAGATKYPFKTQMQTNGFIVATFPKKTQPGAPLQAPLSVTIDLPRVIANGSTGVAVRISDGVFVQGSADIDRVLSFSSKTPAPVAGNYAAGVETTSAPTGAGFLVAKISSTGRVTVAGMMGDGQKFSVGSALVTGMDIPMHQSFAAQRGYLNGRLRAVDGMTDRLTGGGIEYFRPAANSNFYPLGFSTKADVAGTVVRKPTVGQRALGFLDATMGAGKLTITAAAGEIGGVVENLVFSTANQFSFTNAGRSPSLKLNASTGLVAGSIVEPTGTPRKLTGVLYDSNGTPRLRGFVSGAKRTTLFTVAP